MKRETIIWRIVIEVLILLIAFSAVDMMTSPSKGTDFAVREAVNKKQLEPICMVEVHSAIRSASFSHFALSAIQIAAIILLSSDAWALWQSRRRV